MRNNEADAGGSGNGNVAASRLNEAMRWEHETVKRLCSERVSQDYYEFWRRSREETRQRVIVTIEAFLKQGDFEGARDAAQGFYHWVGDIEKYQGFWDFRDFKRGS